MANEPQREIEQRLTAYAKERREQAGAPPPLHPATRKMLQGEAARVWPPQKTPTGFWAGLLALGWPRLALGLAVIILAGLMLSIFLPDRKSTPAESKLALNSFQGQDASGNRNPPPNAPQSADGSRDTVLKTTREVATDKLNEPTHLGLHLADTAPSSTAAASGNLQKDAQQTFSGETRSLRKLEMSKSFADQSSILTPAAGVPPPGTEAPAPNRAPAATAAGAASDTLIASSQIETPSPASFAASAPRLPPPAPVQPAAPPALAAAPPEDAHLGAAGGIGGGGGGGGGFGGAANSPASQPALAGQQFTRVDTAAATRRLNYATGAANILSSFRVEQTGDQLRIIDSDGSIYLGAKISETEKTPLAADQAKAAPAQLAGTLQESANFKKVAALDAPANSTASAPASAAAPPMAPGFSFQVSGTNLTLNQPIVFTGRFSAAAPPPPTTPAASTVNPPNGQSPAGTQIYRLPLSKTRITGRLTLGASQLDLTAEAAP